MQTINLLTLTIFVAAGLAGIWAHWFKKHKRAELLCTFREYLLEDYPGRSMSMIGVFIGMSFAAAASGAINGLDLAIAWSLIKHGTVHVPTVSVISSAFMLGWTLDSAINKGL